MKAIRDNAPFILGCFASYAGFIILSALIGLGISSFLITRFLSQQSDLAIFLLSLGVNGLSSYISFLASVRWVALPLLKRTKPITGKTERFFLVEWLLFSVLVYISGTLPLSLLPVFPGTADLQTIIGYLWMALINFLLYKGVVEGYAFRYIEKTVRESDAEVKVT